MARVKVKLQFRGVAHGKQLLFVHPTTQASAWVSTDAVSEGAKLVQKASTKLGQTLEVEVEEDVLKDVGLVETPK
jgi:hypothetical protein